ncbi:MAG: hypothetical protein WA691_01380 [Thermoplasmata archaeon]
MILHTAETILLDSLLIATPTDANAISRGELALVAACDGCVRFPASPEELRRRDSISAAHRKTLDRRRLEWNQVLVRNAVPAVQLMAGGLTAEQADHFGVPLEAWARECVRASLVSPKTLQKVGKPVARRLERGRKVMIKHPNGTQLELGLAGRRPYLDDGAVDEKDRESGWMGTTVPGGYLAVALDERVAEGRVVSNLISHSRGTMMSGIDWTFRNGRLVDFKVGRGGIGFETTFRQAGRERDRPAVLFVGLNPEVRMFPRVQDQGLGTLGVEIGYNDDYGGRTRGSFRQFALIRGARLSIDGERVRWPRGRH